MADEEYERMLAGKLYITDRIQDANREIPGQLIVQQINQTPIDQTERILALEEQIFQGEHKNIFVQPHLPLITASTSASAIIFTAT
ncbi:hypothetical protein [Lacticaseibacillus sharpeae]|uniref:hypothetical protein n=1 Tax=Lacticaseibacillus sharpeae TaxID=1626 RepID=UPI000B22C4A8|nr:hypothetical protein [Lacticaseibacillus sharpeae]